MADFWNKLNPELQTIYMNYLELQEDDRVSGGSIHSALRDGFTISLQLTYTGDLQEIEALGFQTDWEQGGDLAQGFVDLADLEEIASHPAVLQLEYGSSEDQLFLDDSVEDIHARGPSGLATSVWSVDTSTGAFTGDTGQAVIIGIIDTGIDFTHPVFDKTSAPRTSRIVRIWDPGLTPNPPAGQRSPDAALLLTGTPYGVEYKNSTEPGSALMIDEVLQGVGGATPILHKDCNGHGTHVASTAAGNGRAKIPARPNSEYTLVGVAPEAMIIAVKYFYLQNNPPASADLFKDAVTYILRSAAAIDANAPVVINYSGGSSIGPHDGLTSDEKWLARQFDGVSKRAMVVAAGNSGRGSRRHHAVVTIPASGEVEVPFKLYHENTHRVDYYYCRSRGNTKTLFVDMWYDAVAGVGAQLKLPTDSGYRPALNPGDPPQSDIYGHRREFSLTHRTDSTCMPPTASCGSPGATAVNRNNIRLIVSAHHDHSRAHGWRHYTRGLYMLKLSGPVGTTIHIWCYQYGTRQGFKIDTSAPGDVNVNNRHTIGKPGSAQNVIAVAAYEDSSDAVTDFSSRGPLVVYSGAGSHSDKPDISAPGAQIHAGNTRDTWRTPHPFPRYAVKNGTSMSAPHVTGAIALMFDKDPTLSLADIVTHLESNVRTAPPPAPPEEYGAGLVDAKATHDAVP